MHDLVSADIKSHMAGIADQVARLRLCKAAYRTSHASVRCGGVRQVHAEVFVNAHDKPGTVGSVCQAGTAKFIRISYKL